VWWAEPDTGISELRTLVLDRGGPHALAATSDGAVEAVVVTPDSEPMGVMQADCMSLPGDDTPVAVAVASRFHDRRWRIWSFSAITSAGDDATAAPTGGGVDEVGTHHVDHGVDPVLDVVESTVLQSFPGGTRFGTAVHRILERAEFDHPQLHDHLADVCRAELRHLRLGITAEQLARALSDTLSVPLGGPGDVGPLQAISRRDRLDELDFDLAIGAAEVPELGALLLEYLAPHDPARPWAHQVARGALDIAIDGRLTGSIDLVARHGPHQQVWVADYKTNRLGATNGRDPAELHAVMAHSHYWLQAALYMTATHRYLRWRRPDYDPDQHLVGAAYLFIRGMTPNRPGSGVVWWRPTTPAIEAMDQWLRGQVPS
jgi:exodeoxyribonuclease V beta subunit